MNTMENWIIDFESTIRLSCFIGLFILMALLEMLFPRRQHNQSNANSNSHYKNTTTSIRGMRWLNNLSLAFTASILTRIVLPISLVSFAIYCQTSAFGLFNQEFFTSTNSIFIFIFSLVLFDFIIYWQHRIFHYVPLLWRLHKVHHSDQAFDVTTGVRFHPLEILLSIVIKFSVVFIFGLTAESIIAFEVILNALALFNHSNFKIPLTVDYYLRKFIVTPDMHRVHHSQIPKETNSNFGFNISLWDRLFGSYIDQPSLGHDGIEIGLREYKEAEQSKGLLTLLIMPFMRSKK
jgi:sterol desaturase/sphingolipid hydroxylase (fatty acid hydroxylase superfamily)